MKIFRVFYSVLVFLNLYPAVWAQQTGERMTVQGVIRERRADVKSVESWNAPGDPYYIIEIAEGGEQTMPGTVFDYEWAHGSNRLALLVVGESRQGTLIIVDAEDKAKMIEIPIPAEYRPGCFAWLSDDSGFLLAMAKPENEEEFAEDNFYRYTFAGQQFELVYQDAERQYADIFSLEVDQGTSFWAAASAGEGHPDLTIYQDAATVLATDVYPGSIAPVLWQDHRLWCVTEAYLEFGFTREERERNPLFNPQTSPERDYGNGIAYRIDPITKQASPDEIEMPALEAAMQTSADRQYLLELIQDESNFMLTITHISSI